MGSGEGSLNGIFSNQGLCVGTHLRHGRSVRLTDGLRQGPTVQMEP